MAIEIPNDLGRRIVETVRLAVAMHLSARARSEHGRSGAIEFRGADVAGTDSGDAFETVTDGGSATDGRWVTDDPDNGAAAAPPAAHPGAIGARDARATARGAAA